MTHRIRTVEEQLALLAPPMRQPAFDTADVAYVVEDTPIGRMLLACNESGAVVASSFVPSADAEAAVVDRLARALSPRVLRLPRLLDGVRRELEEYLSGRRTGFSVATDLTLATPFQRTVLTRLAQSVPYGARTTYGTLAARISRPSASRAVGAALGANPLCVVLPCHRVVGADGRTTGYAGGLAAKEYLLELESR